MEQLNRQPMAAINILASAWVARSMASIFCVREIREWQRVRPLPDTPVYMKGVLICVDYRTDHRPSKPLLNWPVRSIRRLQ